MTARRPAEPSRYVLYVPGLTSSGSWQKSVGMCSIVKFDYRSRTRPIDALDFAIDRYMGVGVETERVRRLTQLIRKLYERAGDLYIVAYSHGVVLTPNAVRALAKRYGREYTNRIEVAAYGGGMAVPTSCDRFVLRDAVNVMLRTDFIRGLFGNHRFLKLKDGVVQELTLHGDVYRVLMLADDGECLGNGHYCYLEQLIPDKMQEFCDRPSRRRAKATGTRPATRTRSPPTRTRSPPTRTRSLLTRRQ